MPANEVANRLAAAAWIRCSIDPGQDPVVNYTLALRSQVSCQNRLIVCGHLNGSAAFFWQCPIILVPLDRDLSRRETTVQAQLLASVNDDDRLSYPAQWNVTNGYDNADTIPDSRLLIMPMHLDWVGNVANPTWVPFVDPNAAIPAGFDLDLYNCVALLMPLWDDEVNDPYCIGADLSFVVFQHPPIPEGETTVVQETLYVQGPV